MKKLLPLFYLLLAISTLAQEKKVALTDMSDFRSQAGNWFVVGDVSINPTVDIHEQPQAPATESGKKKKNPGSEIPKPKAVEFKPGTGILLNMNQEGKKSNLLTVFEHGDIELELEIMLPKGSNSGIYLQGRYEVQLFDSWGVRNPSFSDIGGIYRNWENEPGKSYAGKAPLSNPAKAPGLWQTMKISFRAPQFDGAGKKIANAKFVSVELNGIKIHDNVEVPLPTGGPIENNEVKSGPLMIQGDHGPVAFRNIRYTLKHEALSSISNISYKLYNGVFKAVSDFISKEPDLAGTSHELSIEAADTDNEYGIIFNGNITIPENNQYTFIIVNTGGITMKLNGTSIIDYQKDSWKPQAGTIDLQAGTYPFEIINYKSEPWMAPRLALYVKTPSTYPQTLTAFNSYPPDENPVQSIFIKAGSEPKLLRAFIDFEGDEKRRLTHTIGVGDPANINYVYDLERGNLSCVWRGDFVDATPMWHDRGDGSFRPLGAAQYLFINQPLAFLTSPNELFPGIGKEGEFTSKGYSIDQATQLPIFSYVYEGLEVTDKVYPDDKSRSLSREVSIKNRGTKQGLSFKLAEGKDIAPLPNGTFVIDKKYYIKTNSTPTIRDVNGLKELLLSVDANPIKYTIIW